MTSTFPLARVTDRKLNELIAGGNAGYGVDAVREEMRRRINKYRQLKRFRDPDYTVVDIAPRDNGEGR
jgi:hypothetical protein